MNHFLDQRSPPKPQTADLSALLTLANQGDADAQFCLGLHYGNTKEEACDLVVAARWYRKAADQNHALAQFNLAVMFACGQGVPRDDAAAADWLRKAAEGGDAGGQYNLGLRCHRASVDPLRLGTVESRIEAYKWLHLAAAQGYKDSLTACQRVILTMTRAEFAEGNRRAAAFVVRSPATP